MRKLKLTSLLSSTISKKRLHWRKQFTCNTLVSANDSAYCHEFLNQKNINEELGLPSLLPYQRFVILFLPVKTWITIAADKYS